MKLSCLPVSFFAEIIDGRMSIEQWASMGAELGLDGVDLSILFLAERSLERGAQAVEAARRLRDQLAAIPMRIAMVTTYPDFTHPSPEQRARELEQEILAVKIAAALGADVIRVTDGQAHPETSIPEGIAWAAQGLTCLAEAAGDLGVKLAFENHAKPGAWQYTDFSQRPEIFLQILDQVPSPLLGVNFDLGNAAAFSEDPLAFLRQVLPRIFSIHASDTAEHGALKHVLLGTGVTPYPDLFGCLKSSGYDGWICMEEASYRGREGVRLAADFVRRTWEAAGPAPQTPIRS